MGILLKKLALKSVIQQGKFEGYTVERIIKEGKQQFLIYSYYSYSMISFIDPVLEILGITPDHQIPKPGKVGKEDRLKHMRVICDFDNPEKLEKYRETMRSLKEKSICIEKGKLRAFARDNVNKARLQSRNQGRGVA